MQAHYKKKLKKKTKLEALFNVIKGAVSRQSSSFCLILRIACPQSLWNLK